MYQFNRPSSYILGAAFLGATALAAGLAVSGQDNEQAYEQLVKLLKEEIHLLEGVKDAGSAAEAVEPVRNTIKQLSQLTEIVPDNQAFSIYVLRDESRKTEMNHTLLALTVQKQRLIKQDCFGQSELQALLKNQH
ncbi:MAG: hypothetical protein R3Y56_00745 [Akkermansia sp.]